MKNITNRFRRVISLCTLAGLLFMSACSDDDNGSSNEVMLLSFGPAGVQHGEDIVFIGQNLNKITSVVFEPGVEVASGQFKEASSASFKVVVPHAAKAGRVKLNYAGGAIESKTILDFKVDVVISSIPAEAKPGTNITITGTKLNWIESITFPADILVEKEDFVSQSETELVVQVPVDAQTGYLKFESSGTEPMSFDSEEQLLVTLPVINSLNPTSIKHAEALTITGTDLDLVTEITFPGGAKVAKSAFASQSVSTIEVAVPVTSVNGKITLAVASGLTVESVGSISIILPNVTAFTPSDTEQHDPGVELTMTGTNLDLVKSISFPGVATAVTSFVSQSVTQIKVVIPEGVQGGSVQLTTIHDYVVPVAVPFGDQLQLAVVFYDDAVSSDFGQWDGWGSTTDWNSTEQIRLGSKAIKATYPSGEWNGAAQLGGGSVPTAGNAMFVFSIYGGAGTEGKKIQVLVKISGAQPTKQVTIKEGAWTDVQIPLAELGSGNITELFFQNVDFNGTVYIDHIGLK